MPRVSYVAKEGSWIGANWEQAMGEVCIRTWKNCFLNKLPNHVFSFQFHLCQEFLMYIVAKEGSWIWANCVRTHNMTYIDSMFFDAHQLCTSVTCLRWGKSVLYPFWNVHWYCTYTQYDCGNYCLDSSGHNHSNLFRKVIYF